MMRQALKKSGGTVSLLFSVIILLAGWWLLALVLNSPAVPPPLGALKCFLASLRGDLSIHLGVSLYRVLVSLMLAAVLGVPLGILLGKNPDLDARISPMIYLTYPVPKVVFMPIFLILLGIGDISKIVLITLIIFYQILVTTRPVTGGRLPGSLPARFSSRVPAVHPDITETGVGYSHGSTLFGGNLCHPGRNRFFYHGFPEPDEL